MRDETDAVIDLVTCATDLLERQRRTAGAEPAALREIALLRETVHEVAAGCGDRTLVDDLDAVAADLAGVLQEAERLTRHAGRRPAALTG